jgi:hypothetical protein
VGVAAFAGHETVARVGIFGGAFDLFAVSYVFINGPGIIPAVLGGGVMIGLTNSP